MRMQNRSLLIITVIACCALAGCGKSDEEQPSSADASSAYDADRGSVNPRLTNRPPGETEIRPAKLASSPSPPAVDPPQPAACFEEFADLTARLAPVAERLRSAIDRTQFDISDLGASLEFDPERLAKFVSEEIYFVQYPGILRGPRGTLIGRAGNALDQSLLLAALLEEAGLDRRIAHARLSAEDAEKLLQQMLKPRPERPSAGDDAEIDAAIRNLYALLGYSKEAQDQLLDSSPASDRAFYDSVTASDTQFILDALEQAGIELGDSNAMRALIDEARDYYWVEYRTDAYDEWIAAHPAYGGSPPAAVTSIATFVTPPDELYHRLRFEVFVEQKANDELIVKPVVSLEATAAELLGAPITFANVPNNVNPAFVSDLDGILETVSVFLPVLNGELKGNAFDLDGRAFSAGLIGLDQVGLTEVFQRASQQTERGIGGIGTLGDAKPGQNADDIFTLTAQWMEYTLTEPDGRKESYRRYLFDRIGGENRQDGIAEITDNRDLAEAAKALLTHTTIAVITGEYSTAYVVERYGERLIKEVELVQTARNAPNLNDLPVALFKNLIPPHDWLFAKAFDAGSRLTPHRRSYRSQPTLVVYEDGQVERADIVNHSRRHLSTAGKLRFDPVAAVETGVWESFAERVPLRSTAEPEDTSTAFRRSQRQGAAIHVVTPKDANWLATLGHSPTTQDGIETVLESGNVVIVAEPASPGETNTFWWRVDAQSGETLGMSTGGYGSVSAELVTIQNVYTVSLATANFWNCVRSGPSLGPMCCFVVGAMMTTYGRFLGGLTTPFSGAVFGLGGGAAGVGSRICS